MRLTVLFLLVWPLLCHAQEPLRYTLKSTPFNWINPMQQSFGILSDIPVAARWGIEMGGDIVFDSQAFATFEGESYRGFKFRPAVKYYTHLTANNQKYICLAFKYGSIRNQQHVAMLQQGGQYTQWAMETTKLETWGAVFRLGFQSYLGKRVVADMSLGLGFRRLIVSRPPLAPGVERISSREIFFSREEGVYNMADVLFGVQLGWSWKKR